MDNENSNAVLKMRDMLPRIDELDSILVETEDAETICLKHSEYIDETEQRLSRLRQDIAKAEKERETEFEEHKSYRDSHLKKFAYKISGQSEEFIQRQNKEEKDYHESLQRLQTVQTEESILKQLHSEAIEQMHLLQQNATRHRHARTSLDQLYKDILLGFHEEFPSLHLAQTEFEDATRKHNDALQKLEREKYADSCLLKAKQLLQEAHGKTETAANWSTADLLGGGTVAAIAERKHLGTAREMVQGARQLVEEAREINAKVEPMSEIGISTGGRLNDYVFDRGQADWDQHQGIHNTKGQLEYAIIHLGAQQGETEFAMYYEKEDIAATGAELVVAGSELQETSKAVVEAVCRDGASEKMASKELEKAVMGKEQDEESQDVPPAYRQ